MQESTLAIVTAPYIHQSDHQTANLFHTVHLPPPTITEEDDGHVLTDKQIPAEQKFLQQSS